MYDVVLLLPTHPSYSTYIHTYTSTKLTINMLYFYTVEGDYINTMKTTFYLNFNLYQVYISMDTHKHRSQEKLSINKASLNYL